MEINVENPPQSSLIKLGVAGNAEFPESSAGNKPHSGVFLEKPTVGQVFRLDSNDGRHFRTSIVKEIVSETDDMITFNTNNSEYQLSINLFLNVEY